eukprot:UC1_evm1s1072
MNEEVIRRARATMRKFQKKKEFGKEKKARKRARQQGMATAVAEEEDPLPPQVAAKQAAAAAVRAVPAFLNPAAEPPRFTTRPRKARADKARSTLLLERDLEEATAAVKRKNTAKKHAPSTVAPSRAKMIEEERQRAIDAYRAMKKNTINMVAEQ